MSTVRDLCHDSACLMLISQLFASCKLWCFGLTWNLCWGKQEKKKKKTQLFYVQEKKTANKSDSLNELCFSVGICLCFFVHAWTAVSLIYVTVDWMCLIHVRARMSYVCCDCWVSAYLLMFSKCHYDWLCCCFRFVQLFFFISSCIQTSLVIWCPNLKPARLDDDHCLVQVMVAASQLLPQLCPLQSCLALESVVNFFSNKHWCLRVVVKDCGWYRTWPFSNSYRKWQWKLIDVAQKMANEKWQMLQVTYVVVDWIVSMSLEQSSLGWTHQWTIHVRKGGIIEVLLNLNLVYT